MFCTKLKENDGEMATMCLTLDVGSAVNTISNIRSFYSTERAVFLLDDGAKL